MAYDKVVDSQQLDADLTSVANAIRTRGGTSAQLSFPADFVSAILAIPGGTTGSPQYTFSGSSQFFQEDTTNWRIEFYSSGNLRFSDLGNAGNGIDIFLVGGGGAGSKGQSYAAGGAGGYTTNDSILVAPNIDYELTIGAGGAVAGGTGGTGGTTSGFGATAAGGGGGRATGAQSGSLGGTGGSGGGSWTVSPGEDGSNGGGTGQGTTTRAFGEPSGTLYAGGGGANQFPGGAGGGGAQAISGTANTGGGGGGGYSNAGAGGSGIIIIRNRRS